MVGVLSKGLVINYPLGFEAFGEDHMVFSGNEEGNQSTPTEY